MTYYAYWRSTRSGELYAVRQNEQGELTGIVGPLDYDPPPPGTQMRDYNFEDYLEDLPWAIEHEADFALCEEPFAE